MRRHSFQRLLDRMQKESEHLAEFKLVPPDPPKPRPAQFENQMRLDGSKPRQGKLFTGSECLPGQLDLPFA